MDKFVLWAVVFLCAILLAFNLGMIEGERTESAKHTAFIKSCGRSQFHSYLTREDYIALICPDVKES